MGRDDLPLPWHKSLRAKALTATLALLLYALVAGTLVARERAKVFADVQLLEQLAEHEQALALAEAAVSGARVEVSQAGSATEPAATMPDNIRLDMESGSRLLADLERYDPAYAPLRRSITDSHAALKLQPVRASWIDLREALHRAADELELRHRRLADKRNELGLRYRSRYERVNVAAAMLALLGLGAFGTLAAWFFARLARDIRRLETHAGQIVRGARGAAIAVPRDDEVGRLMQAVNRLAVDLDEREKQIQIEGEHRSHQEKMLTVAALAAGVAHEVNNPLAVIGGLAQELKDGSAEMTPRRLADSAQQILMQVQRAGQATRQLADVSAPLSAELGWVDVNALLRQSAQLMGYDRRYRRFVFELRLDPALPAVRSSGGAVQQVLMQLLSLLCAALADRPERPLTVLLVTKAEPEGVAVQIFSPPALDFNRSDVQRSLLLSRAIVEPLRGRLAFGQVDPTLQRIQLQLPVNPYEDPE
jgi:signal transduction histidine kinase